jgi:hypothetical protein
LVLALAGSSRAQSQSTASKSARAKQSAPKGQHEGITVHGYWTIDVHNPDGKLVKHVEFENALIPTLGQPLLMALMTGANSPGAWAIGLTTPQNGLSPTLCTKPQLITTVIELQNGQFGGIQGCIIASPTSAGQYFKACSDANGCFPSLLVTSPTYTYGSATALPGFTLAGQMTAEVSGTLGGVFTMLMTCPSAVTPAACPTAAPVQTLTSFPPLIVQQEDPLVVSVQGLVLAFPFGIPLTSTFLPATGCGGAGQPPCQVPVVQGQVVSASVALNFQ